MVASLLTSLAVLIAGQARGLEQENLHSYSAAFYSAWAAGAAPGTPRLLVFPFSGKAFALALPFALRAFAFGPDGRRLYAAPTSLHGLFVIEFNPMRATLVRGSEALVIDSVAVPSHADKIVISGHRLTLGATESKVGLPAELGIFELDPKNGEIRIVARLEPHPLAINGEEWSGVSVSPDGTRAVAFRRRELELIELRSGTVTQVGHGLEGGAWSPDGKWLAVNDRKKVKTVLLDANTLEPRRSLPWTHLKWSPDSRYLLGAGAHDFCGPYYATLQAIDIETGRETRIVSSRCKIDSITTGWISSEIAR